MIQHVPFSLTAAAAAAAQAFSTLRVMMKNDATLRGGGATLTPIGSGRFGSIDLPAAAPPLDLSSLLPGPGFALPGPAFPSTTSSRGPSPRPGLPPSGDPSEQPLFSGGSRTPSASPAAGSAAGSASNSAGGAPEAVNGAVPSSSEEAVALGGASSSSGDDAVDRPSREEDGEDVATRAKLSWQYQEVWN